MRIGSIDLPAKVIGALRSDELVVFAGAGVSVPPPSNLPSFEVLTEQVGAGCLTRAPDDSFDRFLGRLKTGGSTYTGGPKGTSLIPIQSQTTCTGVSCAYSRIHLDRD